MNEIMPYGNPAGSAVEKTADTRVHAEFSALFAETHELLARHGIKRRYPCTEVLEMYRRSSPARIDDLKGQIAAFNALLSQALEMGYGLLGDRRLTWLGMQMLKLRPPSSLFETLNDHDIVEIYEVSGVQIFRNFEFMALTSYSLEDVLMNEFPVLWNRDESITQAIWEQCAHKLPKHDKPFALEIPTHIAEERLSVGKRKISITFKFASPLYRNGAPPAVLVAARAERVG